MPTINGQLIRRSGLMFPINVSRFVEKAWTRNSDVISMDLEDSVPFSEKDAARKLVKDYIPVVGKGGSDIFVRINAGGKVPNLETVPLEVTRKDLEACIWPGLTGISIPKLSTADEVREVDEIITELEKKRGIEPGSIEITCGCETAKSIWNAYEIATSSPRIKTFGGGSSIDLLTDMGAEPGPGDPPDFTWTLEIPFISQWMQLIATATGKQARGLGERVTMRFADPGYEDAMRAAAIKGRQMGRLGSGGVHPANIKPCNEGFTPSKSEVDYAKRIIEAFDEGLKKGIASVNLDGRMVDIAVVVRARLILERAAAIAKWEKMKAEIMENPDAKGAELRKAIEEAEAYEKSNK